MATKTRDEWYTDLSTAVKHYFDRCFDNDDFGPWLEEGSTWSDEDYEQFFVDGIMALVSRMATPMNWGLNNFPISWPIAYGALKIGTCYAIMRNFVVSYVETPNDSSVGAPKVDRAYYMDRWKQAADQLERELDEAAKALNKMIVAGAYRTTGIVGWGNRYGRLIPGHLQRRF